MPHGTRKRGRNPDSTQRPGSSQDDVTMPCYRDISLPSGSKGGDRSQISQKNKKTQNGGASLLKKAKQKGTTSSGERGVYTNTAPQGTNLHLKRVTQSTHPDMGKLQRLRPNAQNPKKKCAKTTLPRNLPK